jgi:hypothetical protein
VTSATRAARRTNKQAGADQPLDERNDVVMRISIDVREQLPDVLLDLLNVVTGLQSLEDQTRRRVEAVDQPAFLIEEDGTVAVVDDMDGRRKLIRHADTLGSRSRPACVTVDLFGRLKSSRGTVPYFQGRGATWPVRTGAGICSISRKAATTRPRTEMRARGRARTFKGNCGSGWR